MKKITHSIKSIDQLGRISIPKEIRDHHGLSPGSPVEFHVDGDKVLLSNPNTTRRCALTGERSQFSLDSGLNLSEKGCLRLLEELNSLI